MKREIEGGGCIYRQCVREKEKRLGEASYHE